MTAFTFETARNAALKFWKSSDPQALEEWKQKHRKLPYHNPEVMQEIQQLYNQGMNPSDIAKQFKVHKCTIRRAMHLCEMPLKKPPARYEPDLTPNYQLGYTLGVIYGDGFCYKENRKNAHFVVGLNTIDKEFLEYFSLQLCKVLGRTRSLIIKLKHTKAIWRKPYYKGQGSSNKLGRYFKHLSYHELEGLLQFSPFRIGFLRGFFDSEGCICLRKNKSKKHSKRLTINAYNTDLPLLNLMKNALESEEISSYGIYHTPMPNRWNVKPLYKLQIHDNYQNTLTFITKIGSRIRRKQQNIWLWKIIWKGFQESTITQLA